MHITHKNIADFADSRVNLPSDHATAYRRQVEDLRDKLKAHIKDNPDYHLKRMMLSGSLAKRTALRNISDADVALYLISDEASEDLEWLADELATLYTDIGRDKIKVNAHSVSISLKELDIDVVPIYWINNEWDGDLVSQDDGGLLRTNIPQQLEFIKTRHVKYGADFKQVIRLIKYWVAKQKEANDDFRFKSFMVELIVAHLADTGRLSLGDYPEALRQFFDYLVMSNLNDVISFNDFGHGVVRKQDKPINIFDPVNAQNNVGDKYTQQKKVWILGAAMDAADAIEYASRATTKEEALRQWRKIFGSSFSV